ncbi:MAG: type II CRISPR-associated endonuclease Cas1 [Victivallaceae bacterium]|nr:type II CRISPR-associated endonuclease Cas1 [Victivallaceae bacterium]
MIKRTLCISSACHISVKNQQLLISPRDDRKSQSVPLEDVGFLILENHSITLTIKLIELLNKNNAAVIFCDSRHMPCSMLQTFDANSTHAETLRAQIECSAPLKKQLWRLTVKAKIDNQAKLLKKLNKPEHVSLAKLRENVKSGDPDNREGVAARIYWQALLGREFKRERFGDYPNDLANYGYAILRGAVARALTGSGLYPAIGIHHHNRYNAFALADDIMEPYRPFVDEVVYNYSSDNSEENELNIKGKKAVLAILTCDVHFGKARSPLLMGLSRTAASLVRSFIDKKVDLVYPELN